MRDADRRLTKKGRGEIAAAGRWMAAKDIRFDLIAASPLVRAQETAAIVAESLGEKDTLVTWEVLSPGGGDTGSVCRKLAEHPDMHAVLLVGHEPLLSSLIGRIISGNANAVVVMTKGALAKIREFSCSGDPAGELHWLVTAAQMAGRK
jgi:phosphohistidine phosphatase